MHRLFVHGASLLAATPVARRWPCGPDAPPYGTRQAQKAAGGAPEEDRAQWPTQMAAGVLPNDSL
eukprot:17208-Prymnesium_polylepis.1